MATVYKNLGDKAEKWQEQEFKEEQFRQLKESIKEAGDIMDGQSEPARVTEIHEPDVKGIRKKMGLTQEEFASVMGISTGTLRNWEQGRRTPQGAARVLLWVTSDHPEVVLDTVNELRNDG
jgi:putative transcriptional regulator